MRAIELIEPQASDTPTLRSYLGLTGRVHGDWEGYYLSLWAESVKALAAAAEKAGTRAVKRALRIPSPFHFREFW